MKLPVYSEMLPDHRTALDEQVKMKEDAPSIGLILCRDRNNVIAEYALRDVNKPIGISRYALAAMLPEELRASFPTVEEVEAELGKAAAWQGIEDATNAVDPTSEQERDILAAVKTAGRERGKKRKGDN